MGSFIEMTNKKNTLVIIESPFQCLCFIEWLERFKVDINTVELVINKRANLSDENVNIINNTLGYFNVVVSDIKYLNVEGDLKGIIKNKKSIKALLQRKSVSYDVIVIGEFRSTLPELFIHKYNIKKAVYLDDGNAMQRLTKNRSLTFSDLIKRLITKLFTGFGFKAASKSIYFSKFISNSQLIEKEELIVNNFEKLKSVIKNARQNLNSGTIAIIGSPLSEAGVCSVEVERKYIERLFSYVFTHFPDNTVHYFPHRRDSDEKLKWLDDRCLVKVVKQSLPIELTVAAFGVKEFFGFYSTCYDVLPSLYTDATFNSIKIDLDDLNLSWRGFVDMQYVQYSENKKVNLLLLN